MPDVSFRRRIGEYADQPYSAQGELLSPEAYARHCEEVLPTAADAALVQDLMRDGDWIEPKKAGLEA